MPSRKYFDEKRPMSSSAGFLALALGEPPDERPERNHADGDERADRLAALLPDEHPEDDAAHAHRREDRSDDVDTFRARVRHVVDELDAEERSR